MKAMEKKATPMPEELESKFHEFVEEEAKIRNKMQKS